ncbi:argonaute-like protein [Trametopsis cervina]|nr:argonaute-like protein [Trametopsis cervina]
MSERGRGQADDSPRTRGSLVRGVRGVLREGGRGTSDRGGFRGRSSGRGLRGRSSTPGTREQGGIFNPGPASVDARLAGHSEDEVVASLQSLTLNDHELPMRPGFGTVGMPINLRTNSFPVSVPSGSWYEYDVMIAPAVSHRRPELKRRIFRLAEQTADWREAGMLDRVAHDHSRRLISAFELPQPLVIRVPYSPEDEPERPAQQTGPEEGKHGGDTRRTPREYKLSIYYLQELETQSLLNYLNGHPEYRDYDVLLIILSLNLILAAYPGRSTSEGVRVGNNNFFHHSAAESPTPLGTGLEARQGFYSSVRPAHEQLMVNVNVCTTAFYTPGNLAESLQAFLDASFTARAGAFCKGVLVRTTHLGHRKTINGVSSYDAKSYAFNSDKHGKITVEQYFAEEHGITLRYPHLPLVDVTGQSSKHKTLLPTEVCIILPKQPFHGNFLEEHTAEMIQVASRSPNINATAITERGIRELGYFDEQDLLTTFGVNIGKDMAVVPGRILPPPIIRYGRGAPRVDEHAGWNLHDVRFAVGGKLDNWAVLLIKDGNDRAEFQGPKDPALRETMDKFIDVCAKSGISVLRNPANVVEAQLPRKSREHPLRTDAINAIRAAMISIKRKPSLYLVILSNGDRHVYSGLKHLADSFLDVATVCVQVEKFRRDKARGQSQYFASVALKVNAKLGGVNYRVEGGSSTWLNQTPTMLVGIDVAQRGFGAVQGTPSIAAVVASIDKDYAQFPASLRIQESSKVMLSDLRDMMEERLDAFQAKRGILPKRILVYRNGVSEAHFRTVVTHEMPQLRQAFRKFTKDDRSYTPKLTMVICSKRHHIRFYPTEAEHATADGNLRPGTVVDRGVTAIYEHDFFLQAHCGLKGTTRPTHYYVVQDEIGFTADLLQTLTNDLSYMSARTTKALSLASPAYYAHLACERGRCYLHKLDQGFPHWETTETSEDVERELGYRGGQVLWHGGVGKALSNTMFYL